MNNSIPAPAFDIEAVNDLVIYLDKLNRKLRIASDQASINQYEDTSIKKYCDIIYYDVPLELVHFYCNELEASESLKIPSNHPKTATDAQQYAWIMLHRLGFELSKMIGDALGKEALNLAREDWGRLARLYKWNNSILHERFKKFPESG